MWNAGLQRQIAEADSRRKAAGIQHWRAWQRRGGGGDLTIQHGAARIDKQSDVVFQNEMRREQALLALDRLIRERLSSGVPGSIGVRVSFNRNRLGHVRTIREDDIIS